MDHNQAVEKRTSLAIFWLLYSWFTDRQRQTLAVQPGSLVLFSTAYHNIIQWPLNALLKYRGYSSEHFLSRRARMKANHHHRFFLMLPSINILSSEQKSLSSLGCEYAHSGSDQAFIGFAHFLQCAWHPMSCCVVDMALDTPTISCWKWAKQRALVINSRSESHSALLVSASSMFGNKTVFFFSTPTRIRSLLKNA